MLWEYYVVVVVVPDVVRRDDTICRRKCLLTSDTIKVSINPNRRCALVWSLGTGSTVGLDLNTMLNNTINVTRLRLKRETF